jgi:transcriptional regulator GlxA family with amidase domain
MNAGFLSTGTLIMLSCVAAPLALAQPARDVRVAFVISEGFDLMDFAGPWEVFQDVMLAGKGASNAQAPFSLYTISTGTRPIKSAGGATVVPQYTLTSAPKPDIVVIGAQTDHSPELLAWLREQNASRVTIMSVCVGARQLALSGLIDGRPATSHHEFIDQFKQRFPKVQWKSSRRYVRSADLIYTAGGLTSGIDLALHLVSLRLGAAIAQATADYMEYQGKAWQQPE